jgi:hypothetical protein
VRPNTRSIVLLPYGLPAGEAAREQCTKLILQCGGDIDRMLDAPAGNVERFAKHVARVPVLRDEESPEQPVVVLTKTSPLPLMVISARRTLEAAIPSLKSAIWLIQVDLKEDPFFVKSAQQLGILNADLSTAPLWFGPDQAAYLVFSQHVVDMDQIPGRLQQLASLTDRMRRARPSSGAMLAAKPVR